jgi:hypothetical protein
MGAIQQTIVMTDESSRKRFLQVCAPADSTLTQLTRIFVQYAQQNSAKLNYPAAFVAMLALWQAYPCKYE